MRARSPSCANTERNRCAMRSEVLLASALLVGACGSDWRTDMWYQPSVRSGTAPRPEPSRSVPLTAPPVVLVDRDDTEDLKNPIAPSTASVTHGASLFAARCQCCHGA